MISVINKDI